MTGGRVHGSAVAIGGRGVLILGASGSGKSDLALRLIDRGAVLIADDQVELAPRDGRLVACALAILHGRIEVRGVGIVDVEVTRAPLALAVDIDRDPDRLPEPAVIALYGVELPLIALAPFAASAPIKVELALKRFGLSLEVAPS
ncbi:MAG: HPr kinase/phosphatase C-terminal domain-containing protein [Sphingomonadaceae bacterium]|nr:HPr kinase/phosphatase C-terminal domain-containing protein [Sphingomonadaceae bacterium]